MFLQKLKKEGEKMVKFNRQYYTKNVSKMEYVTIKNA